MTVDAQQAHTSLYRRQARRGDRYQVLRELRPITSGGRRRKYTLAQHSVSYISENVGGLNSDSLTTRHLTRPYRGLTEIVPHIRRPTTSSPQASTQVDSGVSLTNLKANQGHHGKM